MEELCQTEWSFKALYIHGNGITWMYALRDTGDVMFSVLWSRVELKDMVTNFSMLYESRITILLLFNFISLPSEKIISKILQKNQLDQDHVSVVCKLAVLPLK